MTPARREAISFAAYRILVERYTFSRSASTTLAITIAAIAAVAIICFMMIP